MKFENGISLTEIDEGLLIQQYDQAYVARKWRLSEVVVDLFRAALDSGLIWVIREGHPRVDCRWPSRRGVVYIAFSSTPQDQWSLAIDTVRKNGSDFGKAVFNGKYQEQFLRRGIKFSFEKRNLGAGHMEVARVDVFPTINALAEFEHSVLQLSRAGGSIIGFSTEYDIQNTIQHNWNDTPFARSTRLIGTEIPLDSGRNSRRIDILALDENSNSWLVIELKRASASMDALMQVQDYVLALPNIPAYANGDVLGVLIAERIPDDVRLAAKEMGISAFEIQFPLMFNKVA